MQERVGVSSSSWVHTCTGYVSSGCVNTYLVTLFVEANIIMLNTPQRSLIGTFGLR